MAIVSFEPTHTFISTGDKTAFYTLRQSGVATAVECGVYITFRHSYYIQNLSTDSATAIKRGQEISESLDLPFYPNADFDLNEIKREKAEVIAARNAAIEAERKQQELSALVEYKNSVTAGVMLVGKYNGVLVTDVAKNDPEYLYWFATQYDDEATMFSAFNASAKMASIWATANPKPISNWVGTVNQELLFTGKVTTIRNISGMYSSTLYRIVDESGNIVITYSTAKKFDELDIGDVVTIKGTVKKHETSMYEMTDNDHVTVLSRPKLINVQERV